MICQNCGKENPEESLFCNSCGAKILNEQKEVKINKNIIQNDKKLNENVGEKKTNFINRVKKAMFFKSKKNKVILFVAIIILIVISVATIKYYTNIDRRDANGNTKLINSVKKSDLQTIHKLIDRGADVNVRNNSNETPLILAVDKAVSSWSTQADISIIKLLLSKGADVNIKRQGVTWVQDMNVSTYAHEGNTALFVACEKPEVLKLLLTEGKNINVNVKGAYGRTALMWMALNKDSSNLDSLKLLLDKGANTNIKDDNGDTAIIISSSQLGDNRTTINLLVSYGADEKIAREYNIEFAARSKYSNTTVNTSNKKEPRIGMTADEVRKSTWGNPSHVNKTTTASGTSEQWVYSNNKYIYLENGVVTSIQE
ncbi:zinc-ribbon domain-containing protein [Clostridium sp. P21]|uniref:Zinc-ribbon domain-containing protein n=1 Tax=Clostridium muellerianum TaxID=2716538 RepID=A0A7Y0EIZ3_9CLOT|nr:ankyrin repeat domain-containing protein [Clostridium muellerianum]NMM64361.1 zinc-ribbon domain-containing protein [Clostridium muellerianum]